VRDYRFENPFLKTLFDDKRSERTDDKFSRLIEKLIFTNRHLMPGGFVSFFENTDRVYTMFAVKATAQTKRRHA